jgi:hypothetical protein
LYGRPSAVDLRTTLLGHELCELRANEDHADIEMVCQSDPWTHVTFRLACRVILRTKQTLEYSRGSQRYQGLSRWPCIRRSIRPPFEGLSARLKVCRPGLKGLFARFEGLLEGLSTLFEGLLAALKVCWKVCWLP